MPTFTVVPEAQRSPSPLMVVDEEDEPTEGVPIEQYRAWLGECWGSASPGAPPPLWVQHGETLGLEGL